MYNIEVLNTIRKGCIKIMSLKNYDIGDDYRLSKSDPKLLSFFFSTGRNTKGQIKNLQIILRPELDSLITVGNVIGNVDNDQIVLHVNKLYEKMLSGNGQAQANNTQAPAPPSVLSEPRALPKAEAVTNSPPIKFIPHQNPEVEKELLPAPELEYNEIAKPRRGRKPMWNLEELKEEMEQVAKLFCEGKSVEEVELSLGLSHTQFARLRKMTKKDFGIENVPSMIIYALQNGFYQNTVIWKEVSLNSTEKKLIKAFCEGGRNKEIAESTGTTWNTVGVYRNKILKKIGGKSTADLMMYAIQHGIYSIE